MCRRPFMVAPACGGRSAIQFCANLYNTMHIYNLRKSQFGIMLEWRRTPQCLKCFVQHARMLYVISVSGLTTMEMTRERILEWDGAENILEIQTPDGGVTIFIAEMQTG